MKLTDEPEEPLATEASENALEESALASWHAERLYRRQHPFAWWTSMLGPFVLSLSFLVAVAFFRGFGAAFQFLATCFVVLFVLGKVAIASGHIESMSENISFYSPEELFGIALFVDFVSVAIVVFHLGLLFRLPMVGHRLEKMVIVARELLQSNACMKRFSYLGLILFVSLPIMGGVSGAIMGRLLGMGRAVTFGCVMLGSLLGCCLVYFFSEFMINQLGKSNSVYWVLGFLVLLLFALYFFRRQRSK